MRSSEEIDRIIDERRRAKLKPHMSGSWTAFQ
jgi:hypothetical protein